MNGEWFLCKFKKKKKCLLFVFLFFVVVCFFVFLGGEWSGYM